MEWIVALTFQGQSAPQYLHGSRRVVEAETRAQAIDIVEKAMIASRGVGLGALTMVYCEPNSPAGGTDEDDLEDDDPPLTWLDFGNALVAAQARFAEQSAAREWARRVRDPHVAAPAATFPKPDTIQVDEEDDVVEPYRGMRITVARVLDQLRGLHGSMPPDDWRKETVRHVIDDLAAELSGH